MAKVSNNGGVATYASYLYGEVSHRSADAPLEQGAPHHHRASVVTELLLQLVVLKLPGHHARHHLKTKARAKMKKKGGKQKKNDSKT